MSDQPTDPIRRLAEKIAKRMFAGFWNTPTGYLMVEGGSLPSPLVKQAADCIESILRREGVRVDEWAGKRVVVYEGESELEYQGEVLCCVEGLALVQVENGDVIMESVIELKPLPDAAEKGEVK